MDLHNTTAEIYIPDGFPADSAIARTTHLAIATHQDDIEIMAYHGVLECFGKADRGFMGVIVTDGAGSPRDGLYADYTDEDMRKIRRVEQKKAAMVGQYSALALLDYPSSNIKDSANPNVVADLKSIIAAARPEVVYTHNLADKHDTHVAVALRAVTAIRELTRDIRPTRLYGCEVWRGLDWLNDEDKTVLDVSGHPNLAASLVSVFDSQICGGKRYDLATAGRRLANATYFASHGTDTAAALNFAMDLTPLIVDDMLDIENYVAGYVRRFAQDVASRIAKFA
ncbi:MAG: PIG-L family deacetylase [Armatimonadetes bacterium]|nr:PIG-L family deacetylase [Armatimonadota bacterium]